MLASMLIGVLGFGIFIYGKRQSRFPHLLGGLALMVYPYFVTNVLVMGGIAVALCLAMFAASRLGV